MNAHQTVIANERDIAPVERYFFPEREYNLVEEALQIHIHPDLHNERNKKIQLVYKSLAL